jgi:hypothetical protein
MSDYNLSLNLSNENYLIGSTIFFTFLETAFSAMPISILVTKIIPPSIAGTVFSLIITLSASFNGPISSGIGAFINLKVFKITRDNIKEEDSKNNLIKLTILSMCLHLLVIPFFYFLIPNKNQILKALERINHIEKKSVVKRVSVLSSDSLVIQEEGDL